MQVARMNGYNFPHLTNVLDSVLSRTRVSVALTLKKWCGLDSRKHGTLIGIASTVSGVTGFLTPIFVGALTNKKRKHCLEWVPSHCNISGNEKADKLAKAGSLMSQPDSPLRNIKRLI
ncbi:hypothetical protein TNCV_4179111 [Trichonephila clavipes]|nr:hypothetical protein TNCV_4179111 [Trichonephila clavipes]